MKKFAYNIDLSKQENWSNWTEFRFQTELMEMPGDYWQQEIEFSIPWASGIYTIKQATDIMKLITQ